MHAYLLVGGEETEEAAQKIAKEHSARILKYPVSTIAEVRELNRFLNFNQKERTALFLPSVDASSDEALNALLKNLEEKENFIFILTASKEAGVLPTIVSRCVVIKTGSPKPLYEKEAVEFIEGGFGTRISILERYKTREAAQGLIDSVIMVARSALLKDPDDTRIALLLGNSSVVRTRILANSNVFLQTLALAVSLDAEAELRYND